MKKGNKKQVSYYGNIGGIDLKKKFGQHFLKDQSVVDNMIKKVNITQDSSIFEIGCGEGILTRSILKTPAKQLWVFEIDPSWAEYVQKNNPDPRLKIFQQDILIVDFSIFSENKPWILLANLPYQITFSIIYKLLEHKDLLSEGVIMIQEEVAQKIVIKSGRGYGFHSVFLQHHFDWELLEKVKPTAFYPPPKVTSRLLYFKPKKVVDPIQDEENFWKFIKRCFLQPRRNLKNNLQNYHYELSKLSEDVLNLRAQQLSKQDLLNIWNALIS